MAICGIEPHYEAYDMQVVTSTATTEMQVGLRKVQTERKNTRINYERTRERTNLTEMN
jgi:hypothetical protein